MFYYRKCSVIIASVLEGIFNLSLSLQPSPKSWEKAAIPSILEKSNSAVPRKWIHIYLPSIFSIVFGFVVHGHLSHYFKYKVNSFRNGFLTNKYTVANSVTYLDYISPLVTSKRQEVVISCDLSSEIDLVLHFIII